MRMEKKLLALLAVALLLAGMLPMGALAATEVIYAERFAEVYESDEHCEIELYADEALMSRGFRWNDIEKFTYRWKLNSDLMNADGFSDFGMWGTYTCTKADMVTLMKEQEKQTICQCDVYDGNQPVATVIFKVSEIIYAPVTPDVPIPQYVYYTPDETVNLSLQKPTIGGNGNYEIVYRWGMDYDDGQDYMFKEVASDTSSVQLTLGADKDHWNVSCFVQTKKSAETYNNDKLLGQFILLNRANNPIQMPALSGSVQSYTLVPGESHTFTLPVAEPGVAGKTLEYRWYTFDENGIRKLYQTTAVPQLTLTGTVDKLGKQEEYVCEVGYKGDPASSFLQYGTWVYAYFRPGAMPTAASAAPAPKTGDSTPLTALLLLLGISLAGATLMLCQRRKQS